MLRTDIHSDNGRYFQIFLQIRFVRALLQAKWMAYIRTDIIFYVVGVSLTYKTCIHIYAIHFAVLIGSHGRGIDVGVYKV